VVVHIPTLLEEMRDLEAAGINFEGRLKLSDRAHIVFDFHQQVDGECATLSLLSHMCIFCDRWWCYIAIGSRMVLNFEGRLKLSDRAHIMMVCALPHR
jgi:Adenylosuccinate synthetase